MKGVFITIEGIEGVGKSTIAKFIQDFLIEHSKSVVLTREPGGTILAEKIRDLLLHNEEETLYPETELLLFFAARKQHCMNLIIPKLAKGNWVVCDRFKDASFAYQGGGRNIPVKWIEALVQFTNLPRPDLTILLDATQSNISRRLANRAYRDRIEKEKDDFFERTKKVYLELAEKNPDQYYIIDANLPLEKVKEKTRDILVEYL